MKQSLLFITLLFLCLTSQAQTPITSYPFNGNANDASGGNHATVQGATLTTDRFGNTNSAYLFDGVNDKITAPISTTVTTNYSMTGWVKLNSTTTNQILFYNGNSASNGYGLYIGVSGVLEVLHGALNLYQTSTTLNINQWYYLAMVREAGNTKVYVNGSEVFSIASSTPNPPNDLFYISSNTIGTEFFNGVMDDIKIYNTAINASFIASEYNANSTSLLAYYPFTGNANDVVGINNGAMNGATLTTDRFGNANSAYSFDGVDDFLQVPTSGYQGIQSYTVEFWLKSNAANNATHIWESTNFSSPSLEGSASAGYLFYVDNGNTISTGPLINGVWYHVACVYDKPNSIQSLYVNGVLKGTNTVNVNDAIGSVINFMTRPGFSPPRNVNGCLDEVKIFSTPLTATQIAQEYTSNVNSLIAYYKFNNTADDASGNNLHGTIIGSPTFTSDKDGNANSAISFNGNVANRIEVNDTILLHTPSITISAWVKFNNLNSIESIVDKPFGSSFKDSWHFGSENNNASVWHFSNGSSFSQVTSPITTGQWYYMVNTFDDVTKQHKLYIDGILKTTNTFNSSIGYDNSKMYIGAAIENGGLNYPINGSIDEVKIFGTALTSNQIIEAYENTITSDLPGSGYALTLDGNDDYVQLPSVLDAATQFTIDFWIKTTENRTSGAYWQKPTILGNANPSAPDGDFGITTNNGMLGVWHGFCCGDQELQTTKAINDNKWHHVAAVNNGSILVLYVDGIQLAGSINTGGGAIQNSARPWRLGMNNSCCVGNFPHAGQIDEVRFWNTALNENQIRDRMCHKISNTDALINNLVADYNFDESSGSSALDITSHANHAGLFNGISRITSGAPIGNTSTHNYVTSGLPSANLSFNAQDNLTVTYTGGTLNGTGGTHIYVVSEKPNSETGVNVLGTNDRYFGVFNANIVSPIYTATYNYAGNPFVNPSNENILALYKRNDNAISTWSNSFALLNTTANTLTAQGENTEYLLGLTPINQVQKPGSGNAISFDGTDDYIVQPSTTYTAYTIESWVKFNGASTANQNIAVFTAADPFVSASHQIRTDANGHFLHYTFDGTGHAVVGSTIALPNKYYHVAIVATNNGQMRLFVNGIEEGTPVNIGTLWTSGTEFRLGTGTIGIIGLNNCSFLNGTLDEVKIWNTALSQNQIRDRMCHKINSTDPLYANLVTYYNFDESSGNTTFDGSVNVNNGTLVNSPTRVTSGAPIGNFSAHNYAGSTSTINLMNPLRGDNLTATLTAGAADGIQIYNVNEEPNTRSGVSGLATNNAYFGTFVVGGISPSYNAVYHYDSIANIVSESSLTLFGRNNNSITSWNAENASLNTLANTLSVNGITGNQKELIVGENNPGAISANQSSCVGIVPDPLTGTAAFNGATGVTYQWQDSTVGGIWQNIAGATNGSSYAPPFLNSPKYYHRLATLGITTISSNEVLLDIRGAISPTIIPLNSWNVYAYNGTDLNLGASTSYRGYYVVNGLVVNSVSLWDQNAAPSTAPGYFGCTVNQAPWTLAVKRQGFPAGNYILNITSVDNGVRAYLDGNEIFAAGGFGPYPNITLGALSASSVIEVRAENSGGPGYLNFNLQTSALQGGSISGDQSNCGSFIPALLNNAANAFGGSLLNITYQWQQSSNNINFTDINGATSSTYQPGIISSDTYFRRKAMNANNENAISNVVFIDLTGPIFYADLDGDGFGDPNNSIIACTQPSGYLTDNTDCNDADSIQHPGQVWYIDMDNDGYVSSNGAGAPALTITQCSRPLGGKRFYELVSTVGRDCNDNDPTINPIAQHLTVTSSPDFANGVFPLQGDPSTTFFFEAMYFDANNALPSVTFPRAYLDFESNNLINEPQDRIVVLNEFDAADQNTIDGKKYVGSISGLPNSSNWQTFLISEFSNTCQRGTGPFPHPDVLLQPNVQIFANYIEFSDPNPPVSSPLNITAYVGNSSDFAVQNVVVHMKNQADTTLVYPDVTVPYIAAHTYGVVNWSITTPTFTGLCPMQVTVDYTNNIIEPNELDNVAVASFNNGSAPLAANIIVEANVSPATSFATANNTLHLNFNAAFSGANIPAGLKVAGALVTFQIVETNATFTGFTGANGNINIPFVAPVSPGVYHISGTVVSPPLTGNINPNITTFTLINGSSPDYSIDLVPASVHCLAGQSILHKIIITNNSNVSATDTTQVNLTIPGATQSLYTFDVPPLVAGSSYTITGISVQFPSAGTFNVCAQADVLQEISELNESNNSTCIDIVVEVPFPDLEVISGSSGLQSICAPINLFATIRNGGGVSSGASTSQMVIKQGNTILQTINHAIPALGPGNAFTYSETFTPLLPGIYNYSVTSDLNQSITEANELNNTNSFIIEVTPCLPDLTVGTCDLSSVSTTDYNSGTMMLSASITNVGVIASNTPVTVRFQFSDNNFVDAVYSGNIANGQTVIVTAGYPAFVNPNITMKVVVDPNNTIVEMNEANNESTPKSTAWDLTFTNAVSGCGPDLTNFSYKPFFQYSLPIKIKNNNLYNADTVKVKYQIAGPGLIGTVHLATVSAFNVQSGCVACPLGVSLPTAFVFPQVGTYTLTLTIDPDNIYNESNENNNVVVLPIVVKNKPDMRVLTNYINPSLLNPATNQAITVSVTYDNAGSSNVNDQMKMKLFIDNVAIDSVSGLSGLASNNYATVNFSVPWSSPIPGTHVIKAMIDSDNSVDENDESNNTATRALTVGSSANLLVKSLSVFNYYPSINDSSNIKTKIENVGDLPTNALVSVYYVNNNLDSIIIDAIPISLQGHDSVSLNIPWIVLDDKTKIIAVISNSTTLEFNYTDNSAYIELGKMALFTEAFPACGVGNTGTLTAHILGGEAPYTYAWSTGASANTITETPNTYSVTVFDATGQQVNGSDMIPPCAGILLKTKCFIHGFYISNGLMQPVLNKSGLISPLEFTDTIDVELHATTAGFPLSASCKTILHNDGTIVCSFPVTELGTSRYLVLKHRNAIETWSANPIVVSNNMMYDFSVADNKAFGNNQKEVEPGIWAFYSGDINQDENVDLLDITSQEIDINDFQFGYLATDINGDGNVDLLDTPILEDNINNFIYSVHP